MISIRDPPPCPLSGVPPQHTSGNEPESDMNTDTPGCSEAREVGGHRPSDFESRMDSWAANCADGAGCITSSCCTSHCTMD